MDRTTLQQHLALAQRHAAEGERRVTRREALIAELDRDGHDTTKAWKLLATLRDTKSLHEQQLERILKELG